MPFTHRCLLECDVATSTLDPMFEHLRYDHGLAAWSDVIRPYRTVFTPQAGVQTFGYGCRSCALYVSWTGAPADRPPHVLDGRCWTCHAR